MAQTKRKRPSKHRGNAAGMIEARGRTGRKPTAGEKRPGTGKTPPASAAKTRAEKLEEKFATPPTWRGAINKALIAAVVMAAFSVFALHFKPTQLISFLPVILVVYTPLLYYTDLFVYRRRQRQKAG